MKIIIASPSELPADTSFSGTIIARMNYKIGKNFRLYRSNSPLSKGGYMVINDSSLPEFGNPDIITQEILKECSLWNFQGIVADFETKTTSLHELIKTLSGISSRYSLKIFVPESYGYIHNTIVMIPSAISGGNYKNMIKDYSARFGANRLALEIQRIRTDFLLPSTDGKGKNISKNEFSNLIKAYHPTFFFSSDLAAKYFTYRDKSGMHFVLFDDAATIHRKIVIAHEMGIGFSILLYPEVSDIIKQILLEK